MNAKNLIESIRDAGASTDSEVKAALEDGAVLALLFGLEPFDPDDDAIVSAHAEAQAIAEEAYSMI